MAVNGNDKYYTPDWLVEHTIKKAIEIIGIENITEIVEPSAGDGAFIEPLKKAFPNIKQIYYDTKPEHPEVIKQDYRRAFLSYKRGRLTIGNPPFGVSSSLWKAFCKKASKNSDYIVYISPASQYNSNYYFKEGELIYSELLNEVEYRGSETENGKAQKVRTCLNIYKVYDREEGIDPRDERLEQDIEIKGVDSRDPLVDTFKDCDWFLDRFQKIGNPTKEFRKDTLGIKILNEDIRENVDRFMETFNETYHKEICRLSNGSPVLLIHKLKDYLKKHLYPTREERLEQDIALVKKEDDADYYIVGWGDAGKIIKDPNLISDVYCIKVLNENIRKRLEEILPKIEDIFRLLPNASIGCNGSGRLTKPVFKEILIKHLYEDKDYDKFEFEDIKKSVKVEREYYAKQLF